MDSLRRLSCSVSFSIGVAVSSPRCYHVCGVSRKRRSPIWCAQKRCGRAYTSVIIVPTGVGASIGGFAGDALPVARAFASVVDNLISHPNVLNAAMLYWPLPNVWYVEGFALDMFAQGLWALQPVHQNKVGLVLDAGMEEDLRIRHLQVTDATRASLGLPVVEYIVTDAPLQVERWINPASGQSTGRIGQPSTLLRAVDKMVNSSGIDAVAVVGRFPDDDSEEFVDYRHGKGIDILAGVEAVISHLVVEMFCIPCAHAPALLPLPLDSSLCPKSAAEEIGLTFLPCVLAGLSKAPQYLSTTSGFVGTDCLVASDVDSLVLPIDACGGIGALAFANSDKQKLGSKVVATLLALPLLAVMFVGPAPFVPSSIQCHSAEIVSTDCDILQKAYGDKNHWRQFPSILVAVGPPLIIAVKENETVLDDTPDKTGIDALIVSNYWEALGVIAAHKTGIDPLSMRKDAIKHIKQFSVSTPTSNRN